MPRGCSPKHETWRPTSTSVAENLPFPDERFDAILSFDVFEHVQDVAATLAECHRVLKQGGLLLVVFPGYWQPREHHLGLATRLPGSIPLQR